MKKYFNSGLLFLLCLLLIPAASPAQMDDSGIAKEFKWRNIGPANMAGRITDIEALDNNFAHVIIGTAAGGIFKSTNAGITWEHLFNNYSNASVGDLAVYQKDPNIIYVGTGEGNTRNSISWGDGMYKSTDGGKTFEQIGLESTHHISRVIIHPNDPDKVYVAAQGHLWGYDGDRGLFMTEDGGKTWNKLTNGIPDDGRTGVVDMVIDPKNPNTIYAAFWERIRRPWRFDSGGPDGGMGNGGIYKTENGGRSWQKLTNGLPEGQIGRVGLAIYAQNPKILVALVEHEFQPRGGNQRGGMRRGGGEPDPDYEDMSKLGSGVYRSEDGGKTWKYLNRYNNRPFYYSQVRINPTDDQKIYFLGTNFMYSEDGGKTINQPRGVRSIHVDFHAMWLDPQFGDRWYTGSDGGVSITHDGGENYDFLDNFCTSQFYAVAADMRDPYYVYGGLQDNGTWGGPSNSRDRNGIMNDHWFNIGGGDGFYVQIDPTDWRIAYYESQGGAIGRVNVETREGGRIRPGTQNIINYSDYYTVPDNSQQNQQMNFRRGGSDIRFNWNSPILLSPHNPRTVFFGGSHLLKSVNQGDTWRIISPDLTTNDKEKQSRDTGGITTDATGAENHCSIVTVSESHVIPGVIWAGTDDGLVHITRDDGITWTDVKNNIRGVPEGIWVSRIEAGHFDAGTAYVTFDGHRSDVFKPFVFKTEDYGNSWQEITYGLPGNEVANVIREDLKNKNLLFLGTETGMFISTDAGNTWNRFMNNLPTVPVDDIMIHPRDNDLIIGTHGLGIWICDDITPLQQMTDEVIASASYVMEPRRVTQWVNAGRGGSRGNKFFSGENPNPVPRISFYIGSNTPNAVLTITDATGSLKKTVELEPDQGLNHYRWDMSFDPPELNAEEEKIMSELRETQDNQRRTELMAELQKSLEGRGETFTGFGRGGRRMGGGGMAMMRQRGGANMRLSGAFATPGVYVVKLTVDGNTMTKKFEIREDPLLRQ
ncbi:WD40/YVTN/BNR-like repeat-containing protein [candidate division KSB1 bacterium]